MILLIQFYVSSSIFEGKSNLFISSFKVRGTENVYTQHRPLITKNILPGNHFRQTKSEFDALF